MKNEVTQAETITLELFILAGKKHTVYRKHFFNVPTQRYFPCRHYNQRHAQNAGEQSQLNVV